MSSERSKVGAEYVALWQKACLTGRGKENGKGGEGGRKEKRKEEDKGTKRRHIKHIQMHRSTRVHAHRNPIKHNMGN